MGSIKAYEESREFLGHVEGGFMKSKTMINFEEAFKGSRRCYFENADDYTSFHMGVEVRVVPFSESMVRVVVPTGVKVTEGNRDCVHIVMSHLNSFECSDRECGWLLVEDGEVILSCPVNYRNDVGDVDDAIDGACFRFMERIGLLRIAEKGDLDALEVFFG